MRINAKLIILVGIVVLALAVAGYAQGPRGVQAKPPALPTANADTSTQSGGSPHGMGADRGGPGMEQGGFTIGIDGTIFVISHVAAANSTSRPTENLVAYNGTTGIQSWSLSFSVGNLTKPVQGPDGSLFLVAGGHPARSDNGTTVAAEDAQLFIVSSKGVLNTVTLPGEMAAAPVVSGTGTSYTVYVKVSTITLVESEAPQVASSLIAYDYKGNLKFTIVLSQ